MKYFSTALFLALTVLMTASDSVAQCAMCRTALENSVEGQAIAEGLKNGILFLLAAPYAIMGGVGYGVFRAFRKKGKDVTE
jgi:hypothetical protein